MWGRLLNAKQVQCHQAVEQLVFDKRIIDLFAKQLPDRIQAVKERIAMDK